MESPVDSHAPARWLRGRPLSSIRQSQFTALVMLGMTLSVLGCGGPLHPPRSKSLVVGERAAPLPSAQLAAATIAARRFADAYARSIYTSPTPPLPAATAAVDRDVVAAATRVPRAIQSTTATAAEVALTEVSDHRVDARIEIASSAGPRYEVGVTLELQRERWRVVAISTPE